MGNLCTLRYYAGLIVGALNGLPKEELLSPRYSPVPGYWDTHSLVSNASFLIATWVTSETHNHNHTNIRIPHRYLQFKRLQWDHSR